MSELALPLATLIAAAGLTYMCCVRPMRRGRCAMTSQPGLDLSADQRRERAEIDAARAELAALRAGGSMPAPHGVPRAGTDGAAALPEGDAASRPGGSSAGGRRRG